MENKRLSEEEIKETKELLKYMMSQKYSYPSSIDKTVIKYLESLKEEFADNNMYRGCSVKLIIDGFIRRME